MREPTMPRVNGIRASIDGKYLLQLEELGEYLGHKSYSQTVDFILELYLDKELKRQRKYRDATLTD